MSITNISIETEEFGRSKDQQKVFQFFNFKLVNWELFSTIYAGASWEATEDLSHWTRSDASYEWCRWCSAVNYQLDMYVDEWLRWIYIGSPGNIVAPEINQQ